MTEEQIREWITDYLKKNPQVAKEYKEQSLARLQAELKFNEVVFNRKGYNGYRNSMVSKEILSFQHSIQELEGTNAKDYLIDKFCTDYWYDGYVAEKDAKTFNEKKLNDEDFYINGVFKESGYSDVNCREIYNQGKQYEHIVNVYKKGLAKRDYYVNKGKMLYQEALEKIKELENIDKNGPIVIQKMIAEEEKQTKKNCRNLAEISVVDAFDQLGAHPGEKETEKIEKIIEMHDPKVVESVAKRLQENPTENMLALARCVQQGPAQSRSELKLMKGVDIMEIVTGTVLTAMGIVGTALGNLSTLSASLPGIGLLGLGVSGMMRHTKKTDKYVEKDNLLSACIDDFLGEVVMEETYNPGMTK